MGYGIIIMMEYFIFLPLIFLIIILVLLTFLFSKCKFDKLNNISFLRKYGQILLIIFTIVLIIILLQVLGILKYLGIG